MTRGRVGAVALLLLLGGCDSAGDVDTYIAEVRARAPEPIDPLPEGRPFEPLPYEGDNLRNPFSQPRPEQVATMTELKPECRQEAQDRPREALEKYGLENLKMTGTLGTQGALWALVSTPDGKVIKVGLSQRMGLNNGKVIRISREAVDLVETVPDGKGCWVTRDTQLAMANTKSEP